jgi:hypothetical protein
VHTAFAEFLACECATLVRSCGETMNLLAEITRAGKQKQNLLMAGTHEVAVVRSERHFAVRRELSLADLLFSQSERLCRRSLDSFVSFKVW